MQVANRLRGDERYQRVGVNVTNGEILDLIQAGTELLALEGILLRTEDGWTYILYSLNPLTATYMAMPTERLIQLLRQRRETFRHNLPCILLADAQKNRIFTDWSTATIFYIRWDGQPLNTVCPTCQGRKLVTLHHLTDFGGGSYTTPCTTCHGAGRRPPS